jgi:hypothetical protein
MNVLLAPSMPLSVAAKLPFDALLGAIWAGNLTADLTSIELRILESRNRTSNSLSIRISTNIFAPPEGATLTCGQRKAIPTLPRSARSRAPSPCSSPFTCH